MNRIGIVANEVSGDQLAASLIHALKAKRPELRFEGMTGPAMEAEGCKSLARMDPVMGLVEVLKHLPGLLALRRRLFHHFQTDPPDLFLGVDAPDFNLALETRLKAEGIRTAHFVSPTVWAWRQKRVTKLRRAVDLMLCIFPFEVDFLQRNSVTANYVGHPLADEIPLESVVPEGVRSELGLDPDRPVIAILPGSRMSELGMLSAPFLQTANWCLQRHPELQFVAPMVNAKIRTAFAEQIGEVALDLPIVLLDGEARKAIQAADVVLTASGTATLETLLLKRPMVVGYRLAALTYWLVKTFDLVKIPHMAMANLIAEERLAPEFLQDEVRPEVLGQALLDFLESPARRADVVARYRQLHEGLRCDAANRAADAVLALIDQ
ncbi:MAG: lipid-A-disaccharide synthase [gamma proteobacterium endosymbiont of Lamellibrachia anaximandri]|nr:lipid-A-disaccharide synthase [gamma proteobacterium endosymbiont of Lamellibrachia anaximandri]